MMTPQECRSPGMGECLIFLSVLFLAGLVPKTGGTPPRPKLTGPSEAFLATMVEFECKVTEQSPSPLTYELIKGHNEVLHTNSNPQPGQPVTFRLKVNKRSQGEYICRVKTRALTSSSNVVKLQVVIPVGGTHLGFEPNPPVIYEGAGFKLTCLVKQGTSLTYEWYHNKREVTSASPLFELSGNTLRVGRASEMHDGIYRCLAKNSIKGITRNSGSDEGTVTVKKYLSPPRLSFTLFHDGSNYQANISCRLARGSPPVTFRLFLNKRETGMQVENSLVASFILPMTVGIDMGVMECTAETEVQKLLSESVDLEVAPVGGTARVVVEYLQRTDLVQAAAALLQCVISRGTFPLFSWSFNQSSLPPEGTAHVTASQGRVLVLTGINAENSGYYSCRARDSFNPNSTWVESEKVLVTTTTGSGLTSVEIITVVFCCFLLVTVVGGAYCLLRTMSRERDQGQSIDHTSQTLAENVKITKTEKVDVMLDTMTELQVEEMETVVLEVEA